jgi:subtilisin family serine protease
MNRNNFLPHVALALVLLLVAGFAGQLRRWQQQWKSKVRIMPVAEKRRVETAEQIVDFEPHRRSDLLVKFKVGTSHETIQRITSTFNDQVEDEIESVPGLESIDDLDDESIDAAVAEYRRLPEVEYAEPNYEINLEDTGVRAEPVRPSDPQFGEQWALANEGQRGGKQGADISAMRAWSVTTGTDKVVVAVLDSGVDYTHDDLVSNIWMRPETMAPYSDQDLGTIDDEHGFNAIDNSGDPMDDNGHGTHCAGIIGAEGGNDIGISGVNWRIQIMPLKFMNAGGSGTTKDAAEAINYVIERRKAGVNVRVISASWGSTQKSRALEDVIREAYEAGILFVAASGNSSVDTDKVPHYPSSYDIPNVISVAALDRHDQLASFSNFGVKSVAVAAPGVDILSTWLGNEYEEKSGTSMATPVVSGVAALILANNKDLSVDELRKRIVSSVDKLDNLHGKVASGGRINAAKAVAAE